VGRVERDDDLLDEDGNRVRGRGRVVGGGRGRRALVGDVDPFIG
jgi:hypothetical protein